MPLEMLMWVPLLPLASAFILFALWDLPKPLVRLLGVGSIGAAAVVTAGVGLTYLSGPQQPYTQVLWTWLTVENFAPRIALYFDGLTLSMMSVITGVGALIHAFAAWYMDEDTDFRRFFAYMNLFVCMMLILVMGDSLVTLYLGWEGVGLCSYLLIGFWYRDPANGYAARKAFIVTRVGDTAMAIGLFLLFRELGTLDIQAILAKAPDTLARDGDIVTLIALLLLGGAVGKSAQLPLQTWLPDAMAGPTPVSALIHAATMVTAGVYLIARMHGIYELSPTGLEAVGWVGATTLLLAGGAALVQRDIKRILAYSTMSQIGYMFMALGAGAWSAAIFHLMTHAFFKALLFLASGAVILACHHEQDIFKMGGLRKTLPLAFWSFVVGGSALAALPIVTSGFWSKEAILAGAWASGHPEWWAMGTACAFLTGLYTTRMVLIVFFGPERTHAHNDGSWLRRVPLVILIGLSLIGGVIHLPLDTVLPAPPEIADHGLLLTLEIAASAAGLAGIALGWLLYGRTPQDAPAEGPIRKTLQNGWGFDLLYDTLFVKPLLFVGNVNKPDWVDQMYEGIAVTTQKAHDFVAMSQNGRMRWYAAAMAAGLIAMLGAVLWI